MLSVVMLSVVMLRVVMLSVVAPQAKVVGTNGGAMTVHNDAQRNDTKHNNKIKSC